MRTTCRRTAALCERICCRLRGHALTYTYACAHAGACARRENAREHAYERMYERPFPPPPAPPPFRRSFSHHHISMRLFCFPSSFAIARAISFPSSSPPPPPVAFLPLEGCRILLEHNVALMRAAIRRVPLQSPCHVSLSRDRARLFNMPSIYN